MSTDQATPALSDSRVQAHFDRHVSLYRDKELECYRNLSIERIDLLKRSIQCESTAPLRMLDIGCGGGFFIDLFLDSFPKATAVGVDVSAGMLRENTPSARKHLLQRDALHLPEGLGTFDVINVDTLMHHLIRRSSYAGTIQQIQQFLQSLHRWLSPVGVVIIREIYHEYFVAETLGSRIVFQLSTLPLPGPAEHALRAIGIHTANAGVCFLSRAQWRALFEQTGFKLLAVQDKPWNSQPYRRYGFKASGDLHYVLSRPQGPEAAEAT